MRRYGAWNKKKKRWVQHIGTTRYSKAGMRKRIKSYRYSSKTVVPRVMPSSTVSRLKKRWKGRAIYR